MNILMVIPQLSTGGAERSFANLAIQLGAHHKVVCVVFNKQHDVAYDPGCVIESLDVDGGGNVLDRLNHFYARYSRLKALARKYEADTVISFLDGANFLNVLLPGRYQRIISQRGSVFKDITIPTKAARARIFAMKKLYRRADHIVVVSNYLKGEFDTLLSGNKNVHVVPNFIDTDKVESHLESGTILPIKDKFSIVMVGRLGPEKGVIHMIRVLQMLKGRQNDKGYALVIVGDGPDRPLLEKETRSLGMIFSDTYDDPEADIYFLGRQSNPYSIIKAADSLALASSAEGDPNVLLEAMACQTLVLSVNCPGSPRERLVPEREIPFNYSEPVKGTNGILMPNFQLDSYDEVIHSWAESIERIAKNPEDYQIQVDNGRKHIGDFTPEKIKNLWLQIIER